MRFRLLETYVNIQSDELEKKNQYIDEVWDMIEKSYAYIGGPLKSREDILKNGYFWKLNRRNGVITCAVIYKMGSSKRKLILCGTDQTPQGKQDLYKILNDDMTLVDRNSWGEFSEAVEHNLLKWGYTPLPNYVAAKVLNNLGKTVKLEDDGIHYTRKVGGKFITKAMFGNPPKELMEKFGDKI